MPEDRLTPLDTTFLIGEDDSTNLCVGGVEVLAGPPPSYEELLETIAPRLDRLPRFRQKLATVPLGLGRPRWVDDHSFRLTNHVHHAAVPPPGDARQLQALFARLMSEHLRRDRPLWELWLVEGVEGGRFAVLHKIHHALVDGLASIKVLETLLDTDADAPADARPKAWRARPGPSSARLLADAVLERAAPPGILGSAADLVRSPRSTAASAVRTIAGLAGLARAGLDAAPASPYNTAVGPRRSFSWQRESLGDFKAVKDALGGSLNDAVLAVVAGALGRDMRRRGWETSGLELQAFVPVSVREEVDSSGNEVSGLRVPLPVGVADPLERFNVIHATMQKLKESAQPIGGLAATQAMGLVPPGLAERVSAVSALQRFVNVVVSNVPGPQEKLYLRGREVEDVFPCLPIGSNLALGIVIVSYAGKMEFGFTGDGDALDDVDQLPGLLHASLLELAEAAGTAVSAPSPMAAGNGSGGGEPWTGYDDQTADEIRRAITGLDDDGLERVAAYERSHKDRATIRSVVEKRTG